MKVVGVYRTPAEFLFSVAKIMHPFDRDELVPRPIALSIKWILERSPDRVTRERLSVLSELVRCRSECQLEESERRASREPIVAAVLRSKQLALLKRVLVKSGYPDAGVVDEMETGFSLVQSHVSFAFPRKNRAATTDIDQLKLHARTRRSTLASLCSSSGDLDIDKRLWQATLDEVSEGWLDGPLTAEELDRRYPAGWLPTRRFPVIQGPKVRPIDDCRDSGLNDLYVVHNGLNLHDVDVLVASAKLAMRVANNKVWRYEPLNEEPFEFVVNEGWRRAVSSEWLGRRLDLRAAYKQLPLDPSSRALAIVCVYRPDRPESPGLFQSNVLPFGATASVFAFNRVARGLWHAIVYFLRLVMCNYYDDYPSIEPEPSAKAALACQNFFFRLLGWEVATGNKCLDHASEFEVLGVVCRLAFGDAIPKIVVGNKPSRCSEVADELAALADERTVKRGRCAQLAGRLQFMKGQVQGRVIQPALAILTDVACARMSSRLSSESRSTLQAVADSILGAIPRTLSLVDSIVPILVFTDGACEAEGDSFGMVVIDEFKGTKVVAGGLLPDGLGERWRNEPGAGSQVIAQVELYPVVLYRWWAGAGIAGRRVIFYIDNEASRMALIRGNSSSRLSRRLLAAFFRADEGCACYPWFARVPSFSNIADRPSRGEAGRVAKELGAVLATIDAPSELLDLLHA